MHVGEASDPAKGQQGDYSVEQLDELVYRLITDELAALSIPITGLEGITSKLRTVEPYPAQPMPQGVRGSQPIGNFFNGGITIPDEIYIPVSWQSLLVLVAVGGMIYWFNARKNVPKRKRKNDEIIEPEN